jgi:predicted phage terminase large subunit-like protein
MSAKVAYRLLPETSRTELSNHYRPRANRYIPKSLTTENRNQKQAAFLLLDDRREVFYGGAAGGAKTSGILAAALQYVDVPGYHALLLRRNYKQLALPGSWIPLSKDWLRDTDATYNEGQKQWRFPSGSTLTFGFVGQNFDDVRKYETSAFSFIGIDELTAWQESDYTFLFSRLRRAADVRAPSRIRTASNPGGRGHEWVKRRFVDPATRNPTSGFLPALLSDNPYIDQADYIESLRELHPVHWRRLLYGDWDISDPGEMFQPRLWLEEADWLDEAPENVTMRVRYWDLAAAEVSSSSPDPDWTAGARLSRTSDGFVVIEHVIRARKTPAQVEDLVKATSIADGSRVTQYIEQTAGAGKALVDHFKRNVRPDGYNWRGDPVVGSKGSRARPLAADMEHHRVKIVRGGWNDPLFDEMEAFSEDPHHSGAHDDQVDACSGAYGKIKRKAKVVGITTAHIRI